MENIFMYAVFPLSIVVLPEESVALHLFEPRYRELFHDFKNGNPFVILFSEEERLAEIGSLVYIEEIIQEFPDGTVDVVVKGLSPITKDHFINLFPNKMYAAIEGKKLPTYCKPSDELIKKSVPYFNSIKKNLNKNQAISTYSIARLLCLEEDKKLKILSAKSEDEINKILLNEVKLLSKMFDQELQLNERFFLN